MFHSFFKKAGSFFLLNETSCHAALKQTNSEIQITKNLSSYYITCQKTAVEVDTDSSVDRKQISTKFVLKMILVETVRIKLYRSLWDMKADPDCGGFWVRINWEQADTWRK